MEDADIKKTIIEFLETKSKTKKMFYLSDIADGIGMKKREIKKAVQDMIEHGEIEPWSSGSTTYYMLPGARDVGNV
jgi:UDP-2,3-diacylglucosamine pyrophosphatase LpxH